MLSVDIKSKKYKRQIILKNVKFTLDNGESLLVLAPSGVGKTTLISTILGRTKFDGKIIYDGENIGYISQTNVLDVRETVYSSVFYTAKLSNPNGNESSQSSLTKEKLKNLGMSHLLDRRIKNLSGGQQKRTQIAQQLVRENCSLIIADEPDSGLDVLASNLLLRDITESARKDNKIAIVISHNVIPANLLLFSKVLVLAKGEDGASIAYFGSPKYIYAYFQKESMLEIFRTVQTKKERGLGKGSYYIKYYNGLSSTAKAELECRW